MKDLKNEKRKLTRKNKTLQFCPYFFVGHHIKKNITEIMKKQSKTTGEETLNLSDYKCFVKINKRNHFQ